MPPSIKSDPSFGSYNFETKHNSNFSIRGKSLESVSRKPKKKYQSQNSRIALPKSENRDEIIDGALCGGPDINPDIFYSERGKSNAEAIRLCGECAVREACLDYAVTHVEDFGTWGGKTIPERQAIRRQRLKDLRKSLIDANQ